MATRLQAGFDIAPPPRRVPLGTVVRVLFGGLCNQLGWLFFGFGMIFFWVFALNADLSFWNRWKDGVQKAKGVVTRSERTGASENETPVHANHYKFTGPDGIEYEGVSYATGRAVGAGQTVTIEYAGGRPEVSRIRGMRRKMFGPFAAIAAVFPAVGVCLMVLGLRRGLKGVRLLKRGKPALAVLKSKTRTNTRINDRPVYRLTFEFMADDSVTYETICKTHMVKAVTDDEQERVLYDSTRPSYAVLLDNLPGLPEIDRSGNLRSRGRVWLVLLIPGISVIGHGTYAYMRYIADLS